MARAIFTVKDEDELRALPTAHPVRPVGDGDIAIMSGGDIADDIIVFQAQSAISPIEDMPNSLASDDDGIQWGVTARGFGNGGVPRSTRIKTVPQTPSSEWNEIGTYNFVAEMLGGRRDSYDLAYAFVYEGNVFIIDGDYILEYDPITAETVEHTNPTFGWGTTNLDNNGFCFCEENQLLHIMGGSTNAQTEHSTFDPSDGTYAVGGLAPMLVGDYYIVGIDMTAYNGNIYVVMSDFAVYEYDVSGDSWVLRKAYDGESDTPYEAIVDPENAGCFVTVNYYSGIHRFDTSDWTWELLYGFPTTIEKPCTFAYYVYSGVYLVMSNQYAYAYDAVLDVSERIDSDFDFNLLRYTATADIGNGMLIGGTDNYGTYICRISLHDFVTLEIDNG